MTSTKTTVSRTLPDGRVLSLETGQLALQAGGSVLVRLGDTVVLVAATCATTPRQGIDFFPLLVDFEEKLYAAGKIPGGFFRREGRPTEKAILSARLVDRPIRPLFPKGFRNDVQLVVTPLSVDQENSPDVLGIFGSSAALLISNTPFETPIGAVRVAKKGSEYFVLPLNSQLQGSELSIVVAGTADKVIMIEAEGTEVSEADVLRAIELSLENIRIMVELQVELRQKAGKPKMVPDLHLPSPVFEKWVRENGEKAIHASLKLETKSEQQEKLAALKVTLQKQIEESTNPEIQKVLKESPFDLPTVMEQIEKDFVRKMIVTEGRRLDGRKLDELREISAEVGIVPRAHGTGLFARGQTQVLTIATLGALGDAQKLEGLEDVEEAKKRYMHHYNFPAFSVGEVRPLRGPGRREIGHGALAERALLSMIPKEEDFPYTIRLVSEVLGSNGSTSMASTCGSTLALMDAGVPLKQPVAGISIGLIKDGDKEILLTDIQGMEDHLGDMDFKVAGTRNGINAIQLDLKIDGISLPLIKQIFERARESRLKILDIMQQAIERPREELSQYAPRVHMVMIDPSKIGAVIGPGGKMIRRIQEEAGVDLDIEDDGKIHITSASSEGLEKAKQMIHDITFEPEVGQTYTGKVTRLMDFGAFVEIAPGKEGLVHISELGLDRVERVEDEVNIGDEVTVKLTEVDDKGRYNLSRRQALGGEPAHAGRPPRRDGGGSRPFGRDRRGGGGGGFRGGSGGRFR